MKACGYLTTLVILILGIYTSIPVRSDDSVAEIAFIRASGERCCARYDIVVIQVNDYQISKTIPLTENGQAGWYAELAWSKDGEHLVFIDQKTPSGIYVMNADGSNRVNLLPELKFVSNPDWSPEGNRIIFVNSAKGINQPEFDILSLDTGTYTTVLEGLGYIDEPVWSPDGTEIAFTKATGDGGSEIFVMTANGTNVHQLTDYNGARLARWSPDGTKLLFIAGGLFIINRDGTDMRELIPVSHDSRSYALEADWSPDGQQIAAHAVINNVYGMHLIDVSTGDARHIEGTTGTNVYSSLAWRPVPEADK